MNRSKIKDFAVSTHFTTAMDFSFGIFPITIIPRFNRTVYRFVNSLFSCDFAIPHISSVTSCTLHRRVLLTFICQPQRKSQVEYSLGMASVGVFFCLKLLPNIQSKYRYIKQSIMKKLIRNRYIDKTLYMRQNTIMI